MQCAHVTED